MCEKRLYPIFDNWGTMQPNNGCEIRIIGAYGSSKFDGYTLKGIICDECVEKLETKMLKTFTGPWENL